MDEQFRLTVHAAGPFEDLAERLAQVGDATSISNQTILWDSGIGTLRVEGARVEVIVDRLGVIVALDTINEWLSGSDQNEVLVEITTTFAKPLRRTD